MIQEETITSLYPHAPGWRKRAFQQAYGLQSAAANQNELLKDSPDGTARRGLRNQIIEKVRAPYGPQKGGVALDDYLKEKQAIQNESSERLDIAIDRMAREHGHMKEADEAGKEEEAFREKMDFYKILARAIIENIRDSVKCCMEGSLLNKPTAIKAFSENVELIYEEFDGVVKKARKNRQLLVLVEVTYGQLVEAQKQINQLLIDLSK